LQFNLENLTITNGLADHSSMLTDTDSGGCNIASSENIMIRNVDFSNNRASICSAISSYDTNLIIKDCLFYQNEEAPNSYFDYLGVISLYPWLSEDYVKIINSTFVDNSIPGDGGVIFSHANNLIVLNSIFHNNESNNIYLHGWDNSNTAVIDFSNLEGGESSVINSNFGEVYWQEGNIDTNLLFCNPASGNFHLLENSPCIDAGTAYYEWNGEIILDISPDEYYGEAPDMGAFEWEGVEIENCILNIEDLELTNYPNPFNPSTTITFNLPENKTDKIELSIYNIKGQMVKVLTPSSYHPSGAGHRPELVEGRGDNQISVIWNGTDQNNKPVSSGIYFYKLKSGKLEKMKKMLMIK
jgi:hypothetical protein